MLFYMGPEQQFEARLDGGGEGDLAGELGWILGRHPISELQYKVAREVEGRWRDLCGYGKLFETAEIVERYRRALGREWRDPALPRDLWFYTRHDDTSRNLEILCNFLFRAVPEGLCLQPAAFDLRDIEALCGELLAAPGGSRFVLEICNYLRSYAVLQRWFTRAGFLGRSYFDRFLGRGEAEALLAELRDGPNYRADLVSTRVIEGKIASLYDRDRARGLFDAAVAGDPEFFAGVQHDEGLATYFAKAALAAAAPRLAARRDQVLGSWRRLSPLPEPGQRHPDELAFLYSCDANFFRIYFPYWLSVAEYLKSLHYGFHFVLVGEPGKCVRLVELAEVVRRRLARFRDYDPEAYADNISYSVTPTPDFCARPDAYVACARFLLARSLSQSLAARLVIQDIDLVFREDPSRYFASFSAAKFGVWYASGVEGLDPWRRAVPTGFVIPDAPAARDCLVELEDYILVGLDHVKSRGLERNALLWWFERMFEQGQGDWLENLAARPRPTRRERINRIFEEQQAQAASRPRPERQDAGETA
ncbi:MAG: hypothetical protein JO267_08470 [Alphaproteobacteria bacterium]|nr:hypothetical protein [Alphaproteobacteria bacterium]